MLAHEGTYPILYGSYAVPAGSGHAPGYLARPDQFGRFPAVLVLPSGRLRSHHKDICRRLARHGLAGVANEITGASDPVWFIDEAYEFVMSDDVTWAIAGRAGLLGLGESGVAGLTYAADHQEIRGVAVVSTPLAGEVALETTLPRLTVPVFGLYGGNDGSAAVDDGRIRDASFVVYQGVAAGFIDDGSADYDAAASLDSYRRLVEFFLRILPPPETEDLG